MKKLLILIFSIKQSLNKTNDKEELFLHFLKIIKDYKKIVNIKVFQIIWN